MASVSFEECFQQHYARLVAYAESMTDDRDAARELAQETFVRLHHHWATVSEYDNPGGWLRRVMSNLLIDHHRSTVSERRAVELLSSRTAPDVPPATVVEDEWSELVAGLPPRQRLIVTLFYGEDLAIADIAEDLELSQNTVKSALSKARDAIRSRLDIAR